MSLSNFIAMPEVVAKLKNFRPKLPRAIPASLKVAPRTKHYSLVGTAFDYLLRFELQRRAPHAVSTPWIAESVPDVFWFRKRLPNGSVVEGTQLDNQTLAKVQPQAPYSPMEIAMDAAVCARKIVQNAREVVDRYTKQASLDDNSLQEIACQALRLAKLDPVRRVGRLDSEIFNDPDPDDVQDLLALLRVVPFDLLVDTKLLLLNPTFGESSSLLGGGDADLISGTMLVDFKTKKKPDIQVADLDELLAFYLLARNQRRLDGIFPDIKRLALYFSRHGYLWVHDVEIWTDQPSFLEFETWFFNHAKTIYGRNDLKN